MKKNLFIIFTILLTITNFVFAADWVQIYEKIYLDATSLSPYKYDLYKYNDDRLYSIWEKKLNDGTSPWKDVEKLLGKKLWYNKSLLIVNCTKKEIATKSSIYYDLKNNVAYTYDNSYLDWISVAPETVGELNYTVVCSTVEPNVSNITKSNQNNIITTPDGTNIKIKYHKKRSSLFNN